MSETDYIMEDWTLDPRNYGDGYEPEFDGGWTGYEGIERMPITCNRCGERGLIWDRHKGKWRLFDGSTLHECDPNVVAAKVFKAIKS